MSSLPKSRLVTMIGKWKAPRQTYNKFLLLKMILLGGVPIFTLCSGETAWCHWNRPSLTLRVCIAQSLDPPKAPTIKPPIPALEKKPPCRPTPKRKRGSSHTGC